MNKDWENFDATKLAFASLGASTIIPIAKPLKPLLEPLKKVVDGMKRFPASKHFAGAVGTAVKEGLSGKTEKIANLLPFILIAIELYEDPEVFEFIMSAIESEDDLWTWVEYIAEVVKVEGGLDALASYNGLTEEVIATNPVSLFIPNAYATPRRQVAEKIIKTIKKVSGSVKTDPKKVTRVLSPVLKKVKAGDLSLKKLLSNPDMIRWLAINGAAKTRAFIQNSKDWKVNRWFVLFALGFVIEEAEKGGAEGLELGGRDRLLDLVADVFSSREFVRDGALFHLTQLAYFHLQHLYGENQPKVLGIEQVRPAFEVVNGRVKSGSKPYRREIDIVLDGGNSTEHWVEVKSLNGPFRKNWFENTLKGNVKGDVEKKARGYYRQFFHDMRLNNEFISTEFLNEILDIRPSGGNWIGNSSYSWYFHKFSKSKPGNPPTDKDEQNARKWLCTSPDAKSDFFDSNMNGSASQIKSKCEQYDSRIQIRDTQSYVTDVLKKYAEQLDIKEFVSIIENLPD